MLRYLKIISVVLVSVSLFACQKTPEKLIIGRWHSILEVTLPSSTDKEKVTRTTTNVSEYFSNGSSMMNTHIVVKVTDTAATNNWNEFEYAFKATFSREWKMDGEDLLLKIVDVKSQPLYVKFDGKIVEDEAQKNKIWKNIKLPDDVVTKGQTSKIKVISIDDKKFVWEGDVTGSGKMQTVSSEKTDKVLRDFLNE